MPAHIDRPGGIDFHKLPWRAWAVILPIAGFLVWLASGPRPCCDELHTNNNFKHRDLAADLGNCQNKGNLGECLIPGSYEAHDIATQFVQRIPHAKGPPFPLLPLELRPWHSVARASYELSELEKNSLDRWQIKALIQWRSCLIPSTQDRFGDLDVTCIFEVFDSFFFGGALRPYVEGPTWEAQPGPEEWLDHGATKTNYTTDPDTNVTKAHIFLRVPTPFRLQQFYPTTEENVQHTLQSLLEDMMIILFRVYTCRFCNIDGKGDYIDYVFHPCLLSRTLGAARHGPQMRRMTLAIQNAVQPALSARLNRTWDFDLEGKRDFAVAMTFDFLRKNPIEPTYEQWESILSTTGEPEDDDSVLRYVMLSYWRRAELKRQGRDVGRNKDVERLWRKVMARYGIPW